MILELIAAGASYGYEIARAVEQASNGELLAQEGTLYPALHRLEKRGYLPRRGRPRPKDASGSTISLLARGAAIWRLCGPSGPRSVRRSTEFWGLPMSQSFADDSGIERRGSGDVAGRIVGRATRGRDRRSSGCRGRRP